MRSAIAVLVLVLLASMAVANPLPTWPAVSLTFTDNGTYEPEVYPPPYTPTSVYLMVTCGLGDIDTSVSAISFAFDYTPGSIIATGYTSLLADVIITGDWETGITLAATEPVLTSQVPVARMDFMYLGVPGYIMVADHPLYPRQVIAGNGYDFPYCLVNYAGVDQPHMMIDEYCWFCEPMNPVDEVNWGTIKSLYR